MVFTDILYQFSQPAEKSVVKLAGNWYVYCCFFSAVYKTTCSRARMITGDCAWLSLNLGCSSFINFELIALWHGEQ